MSFLTGFKLTRDDYPTQAEWIERLLRPLNLFSQSAVNAVNGGLIVGQNVMATYKTVRVTAPELPWSILTPQNGWTNVSGAELSYYEDSDGTVNFRGQITAGTKTDGTTIFTMPNANLYPYRDTRFQLPHDDKNAAQGILSSTDGTMKIYNVTGAAATLFFTGIYYFSKTPSGPSAYVGPDWPIKLATEMPIPVKACFLASAIDVNGSPNTSSGVSGIQWEATSRNEIQIKRVNGLTPRRQYDLTFLMVGG